MLLTILKSKIHRAKVIQADLNYVGSITIDEELLRQSGINEYEHKMHKLSAKCLFDLAH